MVKGVAIIAYTGEWERLIPVGVLAQSAANLGIPVRVFVSGWALLYLTKKPVPPRFSKTFEDLAPRLVEGMKRMGLPGWVEMLGAAKELGDVRVYACSLMTELLGLKEEDLDPVVDEIVGATYFLKSIEGFNVIFI